MLVRVICVCRYDFWFFFFGLFQFTAVEVLLLLDGLWLLPSPSSSPLASEFNSPARSIRARAGWGHVGPPHQVWGREWGRRVGRVLDVDPAAALAGVGGDLVEEYMAWWKWASSTASWAALGGGQRGGAHGCRLSRSDALTRRLQELNLWF